MATMAAAQEVMAAVAAVGAWVALAVAPMAVGALAGEARVVG